MTQYINKSALVAEIEKKIKQYEKAFDSPSFASYEASLIAKGKYRKLLDILQFINSLAVKKVDLEKELESWRHHHFHGRRDKEASGEYLERVSQLELAKHFFELGLARKGE